MESARAAEAMWAKGIAKDAGIPKSVAMSAVTDEDLAFERSLQQMANEVPPEATEGSNLNLLRKEKDDREMLSEYVDDYKPASTVNELLDQVHVAKEVGANSVEATPQMVRHYCRRQYPDDVGYFIFQDIKVWIAGFWETHRHNDGVTMEQRLFGGSKVK